MFGKAGELRRYVTSDNCVISHTEIQRKGILRNYDMLRVELTERVFFATFPWHKARFFTEENVQGAINQTQFRLSLHSLNPAGTEARRERLETALSTLQGYKAQFG